MKITKERIPAATQLFTPDWIVRYMVENSLGRLWLEGQPPPSADGTPFVREGGRDALKTNWKYYLDEAEQTLEVQEQLEKIRMERRGHSPEDITFIDPCMGSGHILVYAFDVFMQIYESAGYSQRDAARLILEKNIHGLDIDKRAYQLAYFALFMKARQYNRRIFDGTVTPQVYHPQGWDDGEEYGSLIKIDDPGNKPEPIIGQQNLFVDDYEHNLRVWNFKRLLSLKYDIVCTNPPYMGSSGMSGKLSEFVKREYVDSKSDLFACFVEQCGLLAKRNNFTAMITQHAWMFLSSYERLRAKLQTRDTINMAHLGARAFAEIGGEVVQSTTFVLRGGHVKGYISSYVRLVDINDAEGKEKEFLSRNQHYTADSNNFTKIPGSPVAYWISDTMLKAYFEGLIITSVLQLKAGMSTGNNDLFQRHWYEVEYIYIGFLYTNIEEAKNSIHKWFPCSSGGSFRKWYINDEKVVFWKCNGKDIKNYRNEKGNIGSAVRNSSWYFNEGITWNKISSSKFSVKYKRQGSLFDDTSRSAFPYDEEKLNYFIGFLCSNVCFKYLMALNPTMSFTNNDIERLPYIYDFDRSNIIDEIVNKNINLSRTDWDSFETSWDFKRHPLVPIFQERGKNND